MKMPSLWLCAFILGFTIANLASQLAGVDIPWPVVLVPAAFWAAFFVTSIIAEVIAAIKREG